MGKVTISPNIQKTSERIDFNGNVIDPRTKQIIVPNEVEMTQPPSPEATVEVIKTSTTSANANSGALFILDQIEEAKKSLANLEELKKLKIAEKKAELELLQK
jgi:hypothetical protein